MSATKESERGSADELDGRDVVKELAVLAQPAEEQEPAGMHGGAMACPQRGWPAPRRRGVQRHLAPVARAHVEGVQVAVEVVGRVLTAAQHEQPRTQRRDGVPDAPGRRLAWAVERAWVVACLAAGPVRRAPSTHPMGRPRRLAVRAALSWPVPSVCTGAACQWS